MLAKQFILILLIVRGLAPRCCEAHRQRAGHSGEVLRVNHGAVRVCSELVSHKSVGSLLGVAVLWVEQIAVHNWAVLGEVAAYFVLPCVVGQASREDFQVLPH